MTGKRGFQYLITQTRLLSYVLEKKDNNKKLQRMGGNFKISLANKLASGLRVEILSSKPSLIAGTEGFNASSSAYLTTSSAHSSINAESFLEEILTYLLVTKCFSLVEKKSPNNKISMLFYSWTDEGTKGNSNPELRTRYRLPVPYSLGRLSSSVGITAGLTRHHTCSLSQQTLKN